MNNEYCSPWLAKFQENGGYDCITDSINIVDAVGETVAEIDLRHYEQKRSGLLDMPSIRNAHKRAQLIAAAPQLLAALRFYANPENWKEIETGIGMFPADAHDYGKVAQEALKGLE
jgi:hypothetical protein